MVGAPDWTETARYDITAKAEGDIPRTAPGGPPGPLNFMLQDLLEDRFKLRAHRETRELPMYALTLARSRRKARCRTSRIDRSTAPPRCAAAAGAVVHRRVRRLLASGRRAACASRPIKWWLAEMPLSQLTPMLSQFTQRIVIDRTGLDGKLRYRPDIHARQDAAGAASAGRATAATIDPNGPSLFTALQEQLGLKLESERAPVEVLVIDHVERPTPD